MPLTKKYREIIETANSIILSWKPGGTIAFINKFGLDFFGYTEEELLGRSVLTLIPMVEKSTGRDMEALVHAIAQDPEQFKVVSSENITKDGRIVWVNWTNKAFFDENGQVQEILAIGNDISRLKELEDELRRSESRYRQLNRSMVQPLALHEIICDGQGRPVDYRYLDVNPAFEALLGLPADKIIGKRILEILPTTEAHWIETFGQVALTGKPAHFENHSPELEKHFDVVAYSPLQDQFAVIITDITERVKMRQEQKRLEEQMYQAQKLESLGVLAGGIAHDFNNILMAILGNTDLALMRLKPESPAQENLRRIESAAIKAADLARQMLAYSGRGTVSMEMLNLNRIIQEMIHILQVSISKNAVLRFDYSDLLPSIEADATQMQQIIMNLVINASEAIGERSGIIAISTGVMDCDRQYLGSTTLDEELPEGAYAYFEVADTGCGMDQETLKQVFDPFFSTKFNGRGLGMAAVMGIVRGHRAAIKIYSEPGKGTTFKVLFPMKDLPEHLHDMPAADPEWRGSGTVLLVDDEETVRAVAGEMLQSLGFDVVTASDGQEALRVYADNRSRIDCVVMDMTMPHLNGEQAFRELRRMDDNLPIIMASGYNEQDVSQKFLGKRLSGFIQKPFLTSTLRDALRAVVGFEDTGT